MRWRDCVGGRKADWRGRRVKILRRVANRLVRCTVIETGEHVEVPPSELEALQVGRPRQDPATTLSGALGYVRVPQWAETRIRELAKQRGASVAGMARKSGEP